MARLTSVLLAVAVVTAGCGMDLDARATATLPPAAATAPDADPPATPPPIQDPEGVQQVLDQVAAGFLAGDPEAVADHLENPDGAFGHGWRQRAEHMAALPLASYHLELDESLPDLATDRVRDSRLGTVQVLYVVEELALEGFDQQPAAEDLFLTLVDAGDGWKVVGDSDAEALGFVSADHLWDHGPVTVTRDGPILAIHHPDGPDVTAVVGEARAALAEAADRWPREWPQVVPLLVPRDQDELGELLHVTFDLSNFVAFATATAVGVLGAHELTGSRVIVNPGRFLDRDPATRQRILVHELLHVATRPSSGPHVPSWLDEGVAQALGERRSTTGTALLDAQARSDRTLPTDGQFTVGGRDRIFLSYQLAWDFVDHLVTTHGAAAVAEFYAATGRGSVGRAGTEAWHVDRAAREVFGAGLDDLVSTWRAG